MFLAQSFKKFLKENFQEPKDSNKKKDQFSVEFLDDSDPGLFNNNDLISNPAYSGLLCNIYHDDRLLDNIDER